MSRSASLIALCSMACRCASAQPSPGPIPRFDAATVRPGSAAVFLPTTEPRGIGGGPAGGWFDPLSSSDPPDPERFSATNMSLSFLIELAFDVWPDQLECPEWMDQRYSIEAKVPPNTTKQEFLRMV